MCLFVFCSKMRLVFVLLIFISAHSSTALKMDENYTRSEYVKLKPIRPILTHGRFGHILNGTKNSDGTHVKEVTIEFEYSRNTVVIDMEINGDLISDSHFVGYQSTISVPHTVQTNTTESARQLCHYLGKIRGRPLSQVAMSTCSGLSGTVIEDTYMLSIEPSNPSDYVGDHFLYIHNTTKKQIDRKYTLNRPNNVNTGPYYMELLLVVDTKMYRKTVRSGSSIEHNCKSITNLLNAFYRPLNIYVVLVGIIVWNDRNPITITTNAEQTLTNFKQYNQDNIKWNHPFVDNVKLLVDQKFGNVLGIASVDSMCAYPYGLISTANSRSNIEVASIMAHEIGHNLGFDDEPTNDNIMSGTMSSIIPTSWTDDNIRSLRLRLATITYRCLRNKPSVLYQSSTCGNEFLENGEQCDCGPVEYCMDRCCNATTCRFADAPDCVVKVKETPNHASAITVSKFVMVVIVMSLYTF